MWEIFFLKSTLFLTETDLGLGIGGRIKLVRSAQMRVVVPNSVEEVSCLTFVPFDTSRFYVGTLSGRVLHQSRFATILCPREYGARCVNSATFLLFSSLLCFCEIYSVVCWLFFFCWDNEIIHIFFFSALPSFLPPSRSSFCSGESGVCCIATTLHPALSSYHLVGRENGSIAMYNDGESMPIAVWDDTCCTVRRWSHFVLFFLFFE